MTNASTLIKVAIAVLTVVKTILDAKKDKKATA